ncbi:MAG: hypothetical protein M1826_007680 [Phylliscum demangeonii]|nr:MAG: hypothetical protein M1826_007680 [Phylliscum demangeonii]
MKGRWGGRLAPDIDNHSGFDPGWTETLDIYHLGVCIRDLISANAPITAQVEWPTPPPFEDIAQASRRKRRARELAERHLKKPTKAARFPRIQGMFSVTVIVTFQDGSEGVLQFRYEPLDPEPFRRARAAMGDLVPTDLNRWTPPPLNVRVARALGRVLAQGVLGGTSENAVESHNLPKLRALLQSGHAEIQPFAAQIQRLIDEDGHQLDPLPRQIAHLDLNEMNIMVTEEGEGR